MAENNELYDHLSAARIVYQETFTNELDIIKELKIYLIESGSGYSTTDINQILYNFYQHINTPVTLQVITDVSINPDPIINELVQIIFHPNNPNNFINQLNNMYTNQQNDINTTQPININTNQPINNEEPEPNSDLDEEIIIHNNIDTSQPQNIIEYTYQINNNNNNNIINVLNSLIINLNNNPNVEENNTFQNVVVTVDDDDFDNLDSKILTHDHHYDCAICMSQMVKDEKITLLNCCHDFHYDCITPYLKEYNYKCPVCRTEVGKAKYNI